MLQVLYGALKFLGCLPLDILMDAVIFTPIRIVNAHIANYLANAFKIQDASTIEVDDHDHLDDIHAEDDGRHHHHDSSHHSHHDHAEDDWSAFANYLDHHLEYIYPAAGVIAIDSLTATLKNGYMLDYPHYLPLVGELHEFIEPAFGVPFLDGAFEIYELAHVAIHLAESFSPYYNILVAGVSFEDELLDIQEDFSADINIVLMPLRKLSDWLHMEEGTQWLYNQYAPSPINQVSEAESVHGEHVGNTIIEMNQAFGSPTHFDVV